MQSIRRPQRPVVDGLELSFNGTPRRTPTSSLPVKKHHQAHAPSIRLALGVLLTLCGLMVWWALSYPERPIKSSARATTIAQGRPETPDHRQHSSVPTDGRRVVFVVLPLSDLSKSQKRTEEELAAEQGRGMHILSSALTAPQTFPKPFLTRPPSFCFPSSPPPLSSDPPSAVLRQTLLAWMSTLQNAADADASATTTTTNVLWVPGELLLDVAFMYPNIAATANGAASVLPRDKQARFLPLLEDIVAWTHQSIHFGGFTGAQWVTTSATAEGLPQDADVVAESWRIILDGLRVIRQIGQIGERHHLEDDDASEITVVPRFHGFPHPYEAMAEGGYTSAMHAETNFVSGSVRDRRHRRHDNVYSFETLRTIDMPHGAGWGASFALVLEGIRFLLLLEDERNRTLVPPPWPAMLLRSPDAIASAVAAASMRSCRSRIAEAAATEDNLLQAESACTLFLSHRLRLATTSPFCLPHLTAFAQDLRTYSSHRRRPGTITRQEPSAPALLYILIWRALVPTLNQQEDSANATSSGSEDAVQQLSHRTTVFWDPFCSCTGINVEAINAVLGLDVTLPVQAVANADCWCKGFPPSDAAALQRLREDASALLPHRTENRSSSISIWVSHKPVSFYPTFPYHGALSMRERPDYVIGRCMTEGDAFTAADVSVMNDDSRIDELWVPAPFLVEVLRRSGVKQSRPIVVVPEAIDAAFYDAPVHHTATFARRRRSAIGHRFRFLSNFKWEPRKGWDLLLWAYFTTFQASDPVELVLHTYLYMDPMPRDIGRIRARIVAFVRTMMRSRRDSSAKYREEQVSGWAWVESNMPRVTIVTEELDASSMPAFYAAHDAFVLPSRGEGWGLPLHEAMSVGLPCIATEWSGMLGFMNHQNSYLVRFTGTEPAVEHPDVFMRQHVPRLVQEWEREREAKQRGQQHDATTLGANTNRVRGCHRVFDDDVNSDNDAPSPMHSSADFEFLHRRVHGVALADDADSRQIEAALTCPGAPRTDEGRHTPPHWAVPDVHHLASLMRRVYENPSEASLVGFRGRVTVVRYFTRDAVADVASKRLLSIVEQLGKQSHAPH